MLTSRSIEKFLAHLFFFFFCAQILSPYVSGVTLYLEIVIAALNPFFWRWLARPRLPTQYMLAALATGLAALIAGASFLANVVALALGVLYLIYAESRGVFFIWPYILTSILLAVAQFILVLLGSPIAYVIGPTSISEFVWGEFATPTFTNFFAIFALPRVSGLSREAGFFASLIVAYSLLLIVQNRCREQRRSIATWIVLGIGYLISFSRASFGLIIVFGLERWRRHLERIPYFVVASLFVSVVSLATFLSADFLLLEENASILHRFGGYPTLFDAKWKELLFGVQDVHVIDSQFSRALPDDLHFFAGLSGFILQRGALVTAAALVALYLAGLSSSGLAVLLVLTANVDLISNQNFAILAYFMAFKYYGQRVVRVGARERGSQGFKHAQRAIEKRGLFQ